MKTSNVFCHVVSMSTLAFGVPFFAGAVKAQTVESAVADAQSSAIKASLRELDAQLDRLEDLQSNAPTAEERAAAKARLKELKERRSQLRKDYVQSRYDALMADVKTEFEKLSAWTWRTFSNSPDTKIDHQAEEAIEKARGAARAAKQAAREEKARARAATNSASAAAAADISAYRTNPTEESKADVKSSLAALDAEIKRLDERAESLPKGSDRELTKVRVRVLKERRHELASDFRQAKFDALMEDVRIELGKLAH